MAELGTFSVCPVYLDVTDGDSCARCVDEVLWQEDHIDVLVNNAGYGAYGLIEAVPIQDAQRQARVLKDKVQSRVAL